MLSRWTQSYLLGILCIFIFFYFNWTHIIYIDRYIDCLVKHICCGAHVNFQTRSCDYTKCLKCILATGIFILMQVVGFECSYLYNNIPNYTPCVHRTMYGVFVPHSADQYIVRIYLIIFCCVSYNVNSTLIALYNI